jgi:hypothetical protein
MSYRALARLTAAVWVLVAIALVVSGVLALALWAKLSHGTAGERRMVENLRSPYNWIVNQYYDSKQRLFPRP